MHFETTDPVASRGSARKKRKLEPDLQSNETEISAPKPQSSQPKSAVTGRRKSHKLADLPGMPLDILFEIFGHLKPYDLLKLTRTNRDFRKLLLSRSTISVWKASLDNVPGLPKCPSGMSEPVWVNLAFSPYCHFCLAHTRNVEWQFRVRICTKCTKEHLGDLRQDLNFRNGIQLPYESLIPVRFTKGATLYLRSDYEMVKSEYSALKDDEALQLYVRDKRLMKQAILEHSKLCEKWAQSQVKDREEELRQLKEERLAAIVQKLKELGWGKDITGICPPDSLSTHKLVNRPQRLTERIWANIKADVLQYMKLMREKRLKREFDILVLKRKRIAMEVVRTYKNTKISENTMMPNAPDYCDFEPIKEILNQPADVEVNASNFDLVVTLLPSLFAEWREKIDRLLAQVIDRRNSTRDRPAFLYDPEIGGYFAKDPEHAGSTESSADQLLHKIKLASTVFSCEDCERTRDYYNLDPWEYDDGYEDSPKPMSQPLFYPQVLGHPCLSLNPATFGNWWDFSSQEEQDPSTFLSRSGMKERKHWTCTALRFDAYGSSKAEEIIKLCSLDPTTTTTEEMDTLDLRFACRLCPIDPKAGVEVVNKKGDDIEDGWVFFLYDWRAAVRHQKDCYHDSVSFITFKREELSRDVILAEDNHRLKHICEWICLHCRDTCKEKAPKTLEDIKAHFRFKHNDLPTPVQNQDYIRDFTGPNVNASQPSLAVCLSNGQLSVLDSPVLA